MIDGIHVVGADVGRSLPSRSNDFGRKVCAVLGINPQFVRSIDIRIAAGEIVTADVSLTVSEDQAEGLAHVLTEKRFVALTDGEDDGE